MEGTALGGLNANSQLIFTVALCGRHYDLHFISEKAVLGQAQEHTASKQAEVGWQLSCVPRAPSLFHIE